MRIPIKIAQTTDIRLSQFFSNVDFLPLSDNNLTVQIGRPRKILFVEGSIWLSDNDNQVLAFDMKGNFVRRIGRPGPGPMEIDELTDFSVNEHTGKILVVCKTKLKCFDIDGNFLFGKSVDFIATHYEYLRDGRLLVDFGLNGFHPKEQDGFGRNLWILDDSFQVVQKVQKYDIDFFSSFDYSNANSQFSKYNGQLLIRPDFNDTVYYFEHDQLLPQYVFDYGIKSLPFSYLKSNGYSGGKFKKEDYCHLVEVHEAKNFLLSTTSFAGEMYISIIEKPDFKNVFTQRAMRVISDLDGLPIRNFYGTDNKGSFVGILYPEDLLEAKEQGKIKSYKLEELSRKIKEGGNPILVFYSPK